MNQPTSLPSCASRFALSFAILLAVLASGCSSQAERGEATNPSRDGGAEDLPSRAAETGFPIGVARLDGIEGFQVVDEERLARSAEDGGLSPAHVAALSDGFVEFAEYEELFRNFVECTAAYSIELHDRGLIRHDILDLELFMYGIPDIPGEGPPDSEVAECATRHYFAAEELYRANNQRPLDEQAALIDSRLRAQYDCYLGQGAELPFSREQAPDYEHDLLSLMDTYPDCGSPY